MFSANKKSFIKSLYLFFLLGFLAGCISPEKTAYEEFMDNRENPLPGEQTVSREIAYLKNISQFEENNFQFVTKQMKEVIKNYGRMKRKLGQIETKLDQLLHQLTFKNKTQESNAYEVPYDDLMEPEGEQNVQNQAEPGNLPIDDVADDADNMKSENSPLIEEEITDDTDIFPNEEIGEIQKPQSQRKVLGKGKSNKKNQVLNKKKSLVLIEAKSLFKKESYENAISKFQKYRDENPKGNHYPEATFYIGQSFKSLKMPVEAKVFFKEIIKSYPKSLWASRAKKILEE